MPLAVKKDRISKSHAATVALAPLLVDARIAVCESNVHHNARPFRAPAIRAALSNAFNLAGFYLARAAQRSRGQR